MVGTGEATLPSTILFGVISAIVVTSIGFVSLMFAKTNTVPYDRDYDHDEQKSFTYMIVSAVVCAYLFLATLGVTITAEDFITKKLLLILFFVLFNQITMFMLNIVMSFIFRDFYTKLRLLLILPPCIAYYVYYGVTF